MKSQLYKIGRKIFGFLSSLKLAVIVILSLAAVLAAGTVSESIYDTETAKHYVYDTWWFAALLGLLAANVLCSALSRWPWKRHHIGFLVTHLGILVLLAGSFVTLLEGYEGQMILAEGETGKKMTIKEAQLFFYDADLGKLEQKPAEFRFNPPSASRPWTAEVLSGLQAKIDDYIPNASEEIRVEPDNAMDNPALKVKISGSRAAMEEWLFAREYDRQSVNLGPATLTYLDLPDLASFRRMLQKPAEFSGPILRLDGQWIPVQANLQKPVATRAGELLLQNYFSNAMVDQNGLRSIDSERVNPAVTFTIKGPDGGERHTVFAKFPTMPTVHGEYQSKIRPRLFDIPQDWDASRNALVIARLENGQQFYAIKSGDAWGEVFPIVSEKSVPTGWMDFQFSVEQVVPQARIEKVYRKVPVPKGKEGPPSAVRLTLSLGSEKKEFWIGRGNSRDVDLGGRRFKIAYGLKSKPIGFELRLDDFRLGTYEGTQNPSSYESQVTLIDRVDQVQNSQLIAMNRPLEYGKYKIFQASYQLNPGGPDYSVLAVAYDPGIFLKYLGSLVMCSGIVLMFFFKPLFVQKRIAARKAQASSATGLPPEIPMEKTP